MAQSAPKTPYYSIMTRHLRSTLIAAVAFAAVATSAVAATIAHDVTGKWTFRVVTANGTGTPTVTLKQVGDKVTGTYESNALGSRTLTGSVKGDSLSFILSPTAGNESMLLTYSAHIVSADSLKGAVDFAGQGGAEFTATRQK